MMHTFFTQTIVTATLLGTLAGCGTPAAPNSVVAAPDSGGQALTSPLAAYPGFGHTPAADEARYRREQLAREQLIAACMQQHGWPYTPAPARQVAEATTPEQDRAAAQDPNLLFADSRGQERRAAYYKALYGVADPNDEAGPVGGGCQGDVARSIAGVYAARSILNTQLIELDHAIRTDARADAAEQRWSACMQERGFQYATPRDLRAAPDDAAREGAGSPELMQRHAQAMEAGRACDTAVGLATTLAAVRADHEAAFVAAHQAVLEQHAARLRAEEKLLDQLVP